jgi:hypothetical protein
MQAAIRVVEAKGACIVHVFPPAALIGGFLEAVLKAFPDIDDGAQAFSNSLDQ